GVTRAIQRLEDEIGARLLERSARGVELTAAGEAFLPWARRMVVALRRGRDDVARAGGTGTRRVVVGVSPTSSLLTASLSTAELEVEVRPLATGPQPAALEGGACDLAISVGVAASPGLRRIPLGEECYEGLVARTHPFAERREVPFAEWMREPQILLAAHLEPTLRASIEARARTHGVSEVRVEREVDDMLQLFHAVSFGVGVGAASRSWTAFRHEGVATVELQPSARLETFAMVVEDRHGPDVDGVVAMARRELRGASA
ncbi:MAG: LysR family transcriptional regulator, partial [Myxococcota bacterium]